MKILFLLHFLLLSGGATIPTLSPHTYDSLQQRIDSTAENQKATVLLEISWQIRNSAPELALEYGMQAMELARARNEYENLVKSYSFVGVAHRILGNYNDASDIFFTGLELARKYNLREQEGYAHINMANLYIYLSYYSIALENLIMARSIAQEIGNPAMLSYVYLNTGRVLLETKTFGPALENIQKALDLRRQTRDRDGQAVCLKYLGDVYFAMQEYTLAITNYDRALQMLTEDQDRDLLGNIYLKKAQIELQTGERKKAATDALNALIIGQEVGSRLVIKDALSILTEIHYQNSQYRNAAKGYRQIMALTDSLFNQELSEKILILEFELERQRRQTEIDLLNKDKEIQRLLLQRNNNIIYGLLFFTLFLSGVGTVLYILLEQRRQQNLVLLQKQEELKQINLSKDKMFMVIGHDLRGPVWSLKALIELMSEEEDVSTNPRLVEAFGVLAKSVMAIGDLLENLLLWAKSRGGELRYAPTTLNLNTIVNKNIQIFKTLADLKAIQLQNELQNEYLVMADENMLVTIIRNLISNAIKFTHQGGRVSIAATQKAGKCIIQVKDNGIGMDQNTAANIFDRNKFHTTSGTNNEIGSGLGLNLCKDFAERHGGAIWVESQAGEGTSFYFSIPLTHQA